MADMQEDSRTALAGRKRELQDALQYRDSIHADDSPEDDRSRKRFKETHPTSKDTSVNVDHTVEVSSSGVDIAVSTPLQNEQRVSELPRDETGQAQGSQTEEQSNLDLVQEELGMTRPPTEDQIHTFPKTWNQGIQSGLRTSFGNKGRSRRITSKFPVTNEPNAIQHSEFSCTMELDTPPQRDDDQHQLGAILRVSHGEDGKFVSDAPASTINHPVPLQATPSFSAPINMPDTETVPDHQASQAPTSDIQGYAESERQRTDAAATREKRLSDMSFSARNDTLNVSISNWTAKQRALSIKQIAAQLPQETLRAVQAISRTKLQENQLGLLEPHQQEDYVAAIDAGRSQMRKPIDEATQKAADMFENGYNPTLPEHSTLVQKIANGDTFYPIECKPEPTYKNKHGNWNLPEILDQGKPIHLERVSFEVFAPIFLANNQDKWDVVNPKMLSGAFSIYMSCYYPMQKRELAGLVPTAENPMTVEQAVEQAKKLAQNGNNISNDASTLSQIFGESALASDSKNFKSIRANVRSSGSDRAIDDNAGAELIRNNVSIPALHRAMADVQTVTIQDIRNSSKRLPSVFSTREPLPERAESMDFVVDRAESILQQKYFPSASTVPRCLSCSQPGHSSSNCPSPHPTSLNLRCGKCRERGHTKEDCPEKLARSNDEATPCDLCASRTHLETDCHNIWRSYEPKPEDIRRVRDIPVHCYNCGGDNHYGPECGLQTGQILSGGNTWSRINLLKYLDPASRERALSAGVDYSISARPKQQFEIKGKGKAKDPISLDDSDDESFIRPKINPSLQNGHIRFGHSDVGHLTRSFENAPSYSYGPNSMHSAPGDMSYYPPQPHHPSQHSMPYRQSGPQQGASSSMRGPAPVSRGPKTGGGRNTGHLDPEKLAEMKAKKRAKKMRGPARKPN